MIARAGDTGKLLARHFRSDHPFQPLPADSKLEEKYQMGQCPDCKQLYLNFYGGYSKHVKACKMKAVHSIASLSNSEGKQHNLRPVRNTYRRFLMPRVQVSGDSKQELILESESVGSDRLQAVNFIDRIAANASVPNAPPLDALPVENSQFLVELASHGLLRRTLARDCWPAWRAVCRTRLQAYAAASRANGDRLTPLVQLLKLPSEALLVRAAGGARRKNSDINAALRAMLLLQSEQEANALPISHGSRGDNPDPVVRRLNRAVAMVKSGYVGRATKSLLQGGLAKVDEKAIEQLKELHPPATGPVPVLPDTVPLIEIDVGELSKLVDAKLKNGSAPGPSGWTGEMVAALMGDSECTQALRVLIQDIINGIWSMRRGATSWLAYSSLRRRRVVECDQSL